MPKTTKKKYYAVAVGRQVGIYDSWAKCEMQTKGFPRAQFKSFPKKSDAEKFVQQNKQQKDNSVPVSTALIGATSNSSRSSSISGKDRFDYYYSVRVNFDGGARGNPGTAGAGAFITILMTDDKKKKTTGNNNNIASSILGLSQPEKTIRIRKYLNHATNNFAEYQGLLCGLERVQTEVTELASKHSSYQHGNIGTSTVRCRINIVVQGDSNMIIQQMNGTYQCKANNLKPLYKQAKTYVSQITNNNNNNNNKQNHVVDFVFEHVYRNDNKMADKLANEAMDQKRSWETVTTAGEETNPTQASQQAIPLVRQASSRLVTRNKTATSKEVLREV